MALQIAYMRKMFSLYPEVLLVNATHNINNANHNLISFMVHDTFDKGQHAQVCAA